MFDDEIEVECPECGHENGTPVDRVRDDEHVPCERCGSAIALGRRKHLLIIEHVTKNIAKLRRSLTKFRQSSPAARRRPRGKS